MTTEWQRWKTDAENEASAATVILNEHRSATRIRAVAALGLISLATSTPSKKRKCITPDDSSTDNHSNGFTQQVRKKESHGEKKLCWLEGCTSFATGGGDVINIETNESVAGMKGVPTKQDKQDYVADMEQG